MPIESDFQFGQVVFFGRSMDEHRTMFNADLAGLHGKKVLDCAAGPSAFAKQAADIGIQAIACDPLYALAVDELRALVDEGARSVTEKQARNAKLFHKELIPTSERRKAMEVFLQDYPAGKQAGRYVCAKLPELPFEDQSFDCVFSGNFLFLYSDIKSGGMLDPSALDYDFHVKAIAELLRVSRGDVRIYPLQGPNVVEHAYLPQVIKEFTAQGYSCYLEPVPQRDIIGAEQMLRIARGGG